MITETLPLKALELYATTLGDKKLKANANMMLVMSNKMSGMQ